MVSLVKDNSATPAVLLVRDPNDLSKCCRLVEPSTTPLWKQPEESEILLEEWSKQLSNFPGRCSHADYAERDLSDIRYWGVPVPPSVLKVIRLIEIDYPQHIRNIGFYRVKEIIGPDDPVWQQYRNIIKDFYTQIRVDTDQPEEDQNPISGEEIIEKYETPEEEQSALQNLIYRQIHPVSILNLTQKWSWAIPTVQSLQWIVGNIRSRIRIENPLILEIGAGKGLWAYLLQQFDLRIIPIDNDSWGLTRDVFTVVYKITGEEAFKHWKPDILFLCWPDLDGERNIRHLSIFQGDWFLYIGEGNFRGETGGVGFFEYVVENWVLVDLHHHQRIIREDDIFLFRRKSSLIDPDKSS